MSLWTNKSTVISHDNIIGCTLYPLNSELFINETNLAAYSDV